MFWIHWARRVTSGRCLDPGGFLSFLTQDAPKRETDQVGHCPLVLSAPEQVTAVFCHPVLTESLAPRSQAHPTYVLLSAGPPEKGVMMEDCAEHPPDPDHEFFYIFLLSPMMPGWKIR